MIVHFSVFLLLFGQTWGRRNEQVVKGTIRLGKQIASYGRDGRQLGNGFNRQTDRQFDNFNNINTNDISDDMMNIKMLSISVPGIPGDDYPILATVPKTSFSCADKLADRNYADVEGFCQVYHTCQPRGRELDNIKFSRLCPNGTIFDQRGQTCRWWYLVDCDKSEMLYDVQNNDVSSQSSDSSSSSSSSSSSESSSTTSLSEEADKANTFLFAIPTSLLNDDILNNVFKFPISANNINFDSSSVSQSQNANADVVSSIFSSDDVSTIRPLDRLPLNSQGDRRFNNNNRISSSRNQQRQNQVESSTRNDARGNSNGNSDDIDGLNRALSTPGRKRQTNWNNGRLTFDF